MQITETKAVTKAETVVLETLCDCCGEKYRLEMFTYYEILERISYPECGHSNTFDVCQKCWETKVVPLFKTGPRRSDW